jgi:hypothetical protein
MLENEYQPVGVVCCDFQASKGQTQGQFYLILALHSVIKRQVGGVRCQ